MMNPKKQTLVPALVLGTLLFAGAVYAQETASFREVTGTVEIKAPGSGNWVNAAAGDRIEKSTLISTGFKSSAVVLVGNSVIMVQPVTRLSLEEILRNQGNEQVNLYLHSGRIRADVNPPAGGTSAFTVRSPIATASVRGTSFEFDTENLKVVEGRVLYSLANGRGTYVAEGGTSYVDETSNTVVSPFEVAAELLSPALPPGGASGVPVGDRSPAIVPTAAKVGLGFGWD
jgi:hypothetical protein